MLNKIKLEIESNRNSHALELISQFLLKRKPTSMEKLKVARFYQLLSLPSKALKLLGEIKEKTDYQYLNESELLVELYKAQILHFTGARYVSRRIITEIENVTNLSSSSITFNKEYYRILAGVNYYSGFYNDAFSFYEKICSFFNNDDYEYYLASIGKADCLCALGKYSEAIELVNELLTILDKNKRSYICGICYQAIGEYYFKSDEIVTARIHLDKSFAFFKDEATKDYAYLLRWSGATAVYEKNFARAKLELEKSFELLHKKHYQPLALIGTIHWLSKIPKYQLNFEFLIPLYTYFLYSPFSLIYEGFHQAQSKSPTSVWILKQMKHHASDCWLIKNLRIKLVLYSNSIVEAVKVEEKVLDLYSGLIIERNGISSLSLIESLCLCALISAGALGASDIALADFIYRQDFTSIEVGLNRLRELVQQLKKKGFKVLKKDRCYYFLEPEKYLIYLPVRLIVRSKSYYLKAHKLEFNRFDVVKLFHTTDRTSKRWLKEWKDEGLIERSDQKKPVTYRFL